MNQGGRSGILSSLDPENKCLSTNSTESAVKSAKKSQFLYDAYASTNQRKLLTKKQKVDELKFKERQKEANELIVYREKSQWKFQEMITKQEKTTRVFKVCETSILIFSIMYFFHLDDARG
ncbi:unnamed protein product [Rotaria socialis]|uniref:Uncharacterized protein n=1 Tax=Rotaria socialis TaxID=392032 RepID=A0A821UGR1_9BILA|nr:unnamed protein product [Rotaria socialis]